MWYHYYRYQKHTLLQNERGIFMLSGTKIDPMQLLRLKQHPIQIEEDLVVIDNLEEGILKIFEYVGGVSIQQLFAGENDYQNPSLLAEITLNDNSQTGNITIEKIFCCYGFERLVYPMIQQIISFAKFYECIHSVRISKHERENWFIYAGSVLMDFYEKSDGYCEYRIR